MKSRIMYIEFKGDGLVGPARIGRVSFYKTGRNLHYKDKSFKSTKNALKANFYEVQSGERYWISGPRKDGEDRLYAGGDIVEIDADVREEYWTKKRNLPEKSSKPTTRG